MRAGRDRAREESPGDSVELAGVAEPKQAAPYPEHAGALRMVA